MTAVVAATRDGVEAAGGASTDPDGGAGTDAAGGAGTEADGGWVDPLDARRRHADRIVWHWRTELAPLSALPGFAGRFGGPVRDVLAATLQGVLVLSLAEVCQIDDESELVRLLAELVLDDELPAGLAPTPASADAGLDASSAVGDTAYVVEDDLPDTWQQMVRRVPVGIVRLAREMWAIRRLISKRTEGRLWHRAVANVPGVGVVGATLGERHAAAEIAARAYEALGLSSHPSNH